MAEQERVFEFLISSPVHSPVSCCLYPEVGLLVTDTEDGLSPERQDNIITTRLEARSKVRALVIQQSCTIIAHRKLLIHFNKTNMLVK